MALTATALPVQAGTSSVLVVPTQYPTIQSAVDAASPGDSIKVKRGRYDEQVSIGKNLELIGAGASATKIRAPGVLSNGALGKKPAIVEIHSGAIVRISNLTVAGPGPNACAGGALWAGIKVVQDATLNLRAARVVNIHDRPFADCNHAGTAILIGDFIDGESGNAAINNVEVSNYQSGGIVVFGENSLVTVTNSLVRGNPEGKGFVYGLEWGAGAVMRATNNLVMGNTCEDATIPCGPDPTSQGQSAGIGNGPGDMAPGSVFAYNTLVGNDVGIYLFAADGCCSIHHNYLVDNRYFGVIVQEGRNRISRSTIVGGQVGVAAYATFFTDATAILRDVRIRLSTVAKTQEVECCGFDARVLRR